jgi:hypothetical protein
MILTIIIIVALVLLLAFPIAALVSGLFVGMKSSKWKELGEWYLKSLWFFLVGIPVTLLGLPIVALAIPFRVAHPETQKPFTDVRQLPGNWMLVTLPRWAKWWSNEFDGLLGDTRGWWNTNCINLYKKPATAFYPMWLWTAVRNPANYWSRVITGCDVSKCVITLLAGQENADSDNPGWSFRVATERGTGKQFHLLQFWIPLTAEHGIWGRFGWKIEMDDNDISPDASSKDRFKGSVYSVSPWKTK